MLALLPHEETWLEGMERVISEEIKKWEKINWSDGHREFFLMNGRGVYIDDSKGICIIPDDVLKELKC